MPNPELEDTILGVIETLNLALDISLTIEEIDGHIRNALSDLESLSI